MGRISKIDELRARKEALIRESEICRQTLEGEIQDLKAYTEGVVRKIDRVRQIAPWFMFAAPVAIPLIGLLVGKKIKTRPLAKTPQSSRKLAKALVALRLFGKYGPLLRSFAARLRTRRNSSPGTRASAVNS
jgi:hypothetical protein